MTRFTVSSCFEQMLLKLGFHPGGNERSLWVGIISSPVRLRHLRSCDHEPSRRMVIAFLLSFAGKGKAVPTRASGIGDGLAQQVEDPAGALKVAVISLGRGRRCFPDSAEPKEWGQWWPGVETRSQSRLPRSTFVDGLTEEVFRRANARVSSGHAHH